ncbi:MBL fold metallo-hydrolase [Candidatus Uabimicrobium amorphum]|uniref:MBL fold metallo-hydrolase n=1 Tax=Uabimicrobium amorphum TaxID=2596890 RepID=A0A5S9II41_UABAM|nr:MBL fold metallo-hydrolase [Candidatus Uabimicrobium amorphum]BBM82074.1 MBL fold metallo-hydrolase [Candidatus Uabimicrobium amorphum]
MAEKNTRLKIFHAGYCTHPEHIILRNKNRKDIPFPAMFALIMHPQRGPMLFDTGYSERFFSETKRFPSSIYRRITPVHFSEKDAAAHQLQQYGVAAKDIQYVVISHFHADHIAALGDFPNAKYIYLAKAFDDVRNRKGISALIRAFLPGLIPRDFMERSITIDRKPPVELPLDYIPFRWGWDLCEDMSVIAVELPGHAVGQIGLFINTDVKTRYFLIADACWLQQSYQQNIMPHPITRLLFADYKEYRKTLEKIHQIYLERPQLHIIPSHCMKTVTQHEHNTQS